jgi:lipid-binding SYLF domain-containing protein
MNLRKSRIAPSIIAAALIGATLSTAHGQSKKAREQAELRGMAARTLARLYRLQPNARRFIGSSRGYAVFSNFGMKILLFGGGRGAGVAFDRRTGRRTYMRMLELQAGLGIGVKKFRLVWVFRTEKAFKRFVTSGWQLSGQATAAAKSATQGGAAAGAIAVSENVYVYQLTDKGLALELTIKGSKYYRDGKLN